MINLLKKTIKLIKYLTFIFFEKFFRLHITKVSFYSPIPEIGKLHKQDFNNRLSDSIPLTLNKHLETLSKFEKYFLDKKIDINPGLSIVDSYILFAMIRHHKPKKIVEIGSGHSTQIILSAIELNEMENCPCKLFSIEPFPKKFLKEIKNKNFYLFVKKVQDMDLSFFSDTDILFIDSTHVSRFNSDVNTEIFKIIPQLRIDSLIHWHDIMIPNDYPEYWIRDCNKFWNETYLVTAFMMYNENFEILWASKFMQIYHPETIKKYFTNFDSDNNDEQLSSFWIQRKK